jgi:hypothetical protein
MNYIEHNATNVFLLEWISAARTQSEDIRTAVTAKELTRDDTTKSHLTYHDALLHHCKMLYSAATTIWYIVAWISVILRFVQRMIRCCCVVAFRAACVKRAPALQEYTILYGLRLFCK